MWWSLFILGLCCLSPSVEAGGLFGGSLGILNTATQGLSDHSRVSKQKQSTNINQPSSSDISGLVIGEHLSRPPVLQKTSDTLNILNVNTKAGIPLTKLEAESNLSVNPTKINASANIHNRNDNLNKHVHMENTKDAQGNNGMHELSNEATCLKSVTVVNGKTSCKDKLVFEENFDVLDKHIWQHVVQFAGAPDFKFVVYSNDVKNSFVSNGKLHIKPTLLSDEGIDINTATLELEGCTATPGSPECKKTGVGLNILPPVKSARLRTKESFSFQYGQIEVQAKLPAGDWIFPEIWLEPKRNTYGSSPYESGLIRLAVARGNRNLLMNGKDIGGRYLTASCILGIGNVVHSETFSIENTQFWSNDFHKYVVTWTPDNIIFTVDGKEIGKLIPPDGGFKKLGPFSDLQVPWTRGSKIAPFDQEFFVSVGVGAGGIREFPDGATSHGHQKPWKNLNAKAMLLFWKDKDSWLPSWSEEGLSLQVEHIKVWAL
ncbi:beta-1,3-glucan-binding protein [Anabrus simplex]|uniref:beta-1,3-glucan-binding protein n=1 Tax=Anabrus simplex TaxID=316456 RepID=UPI0035A353D1